MSDKYLVEVIEYGGSMVLFEKVDKQYVQFHENFVAQYPIDKEITAVLRDAVRLGTPFLSGGVRTSYLVPDDLGEVFKATMKILNVTPSFREKLYFIDAVQYFSHMMSGEYKGLLDNLNVFLLTKKIGAPDPNAIP